MKSIQHTSLLYLFSLIFVLLTTSVSYAALYKCEVDGKTEYSQFPCPVESPDVEQTGLKTSDAELSRNSIHGEVNSISGVSPAWRCQTVREAFEYLPSAFSMGQLWFDYSKVGTDFLEQHSEVSYRDSSIKSKFALQHNRSYRPYCKVEGVRSLRKDKTSFRLRIYAHEDIPDTETIPELSEVLSLLSKNGYAMKKQQDNHYVYAWEFWESRCRAELTARLNSQQVLKGTILEVSCNTKRKPKSND